MSPVPDPFPVLLLVHASRPEASADQAVERESHTLSYVEGGKGGGGRRPNNSRGLPAAEVAGTNRLKQMLTDLNLS